METIKNKFIGILIAVIIALIATYLGSLAPIIGAPVFGIVIGKFMIVMALSAIGLSADFKQMIKSGIKPLILGVIVWFNVAIVSLIVQFITGQI